MFPDSKISASTRIVFKSNSPVHTHPMVSGFTLEKLCLHVVPPYLFIVQEENGQDLQCRVRKYPDSPSARYRLRCGISYFFPHWRADSKIFRFAAEFAGCGWTEAVSRKKKLRIQQYPGTCGRGLSLVVPCAWALVTCK